MNDRLEKTANEVKEIADDAAAAFGGLGRDQLNWKPAPQSWSIAQCFDHLITVNSLYFPVFERMRSDNVMSRFWERNSPLSGFFGRYLIKILSPEYRKKVKTSKKAYPSASDLGGDIIKRFGEHQRQLAEHVRQVSPKIDLKKMIITSPLLGLVTYSLDDTLTILTVHERRHFEQARRVMNSDAFAD
jgi:hypothetical protein